jgi:hypothetical protein
MPVPVSGIAHLPFKNLKDEDIASLIDDAHESMTEGMPADSIMGILERKGINGQGIDLILDLIRTRKKAAGKFTLANKLFFTSEGLRWATPEVAADHCANRMKREMVLDLTCGQGGQILSFSRTCERVIAVDIDPLNCLLTRLNILSSGIDNVEVFNGDCLSEKVISLAEKGCATFSDPSRPPGSSERNMSEIQPDPRKVEASYCDDASGMCFEIPPYMDLMKVPFDCEAEYVSIDGRLNRLNLFLGDLKVENRSAIILPGGSKISGDPVNTATRHLTPEIGEFLNELDPSVVKADLVSTLERDQGWNSKRYDLDKRRTALISDQPLRSPFVKGTFRIVGIAKEIPGIRDIMREMGAGSAVLRFSVPPSSYWDVRTSLEKDLPGDDKVYVFGNGEYIVTVKDGAGG